MMAPACWSSFMNADFPPAISKMKHPFYAWAHAYSSCLISEASCCFLPSILRSSQTELPYRPFPMFLPLFGSTINSGPSWPPNSPYLNNWYWSLGLRLDHPLNTHTSVQVRCPPSVVPLEKPSLPLSSVYITLLHTYLFTFLILPLDYEVFEVRYYYFSLHPQ